ncbi:MAG: hypothetical protein R3335_02820, partial [Anaerolineales bacterium]|nr:hypothetical protein [Anaerolineales bacterium]
MDATITPGRPLVGEISLPGDKSISHRAALFGAMGVGDSRIENFLLAGVTRPMLEALTALGVDWELNKGPDESPLFPKVLLSIRGQGLQGFTPPAQTIQCRNSGATIRFLAGALAAAGITATLDGSPGLRRR